jgi:hypothetical protein
MKEHRKEELKAIYRFIADASVEEIASIISEMRVCHDNILVFNEKHKSLDKVKSVCINGECIQLDLEQY